MTKIRISLNKLGQKVSSSSHLDTLGLPNAWQPFKKYISRHYILQFGQIHDAIRINNFCNFNTYVLQFGQIYVAI